MLFVFSQLKTVFFFGSQNIRNSVCYFRYAENVRELRKQTWPCTAPVLETLSTL